MHKNIEKYFHMFWLTDSSGTKWNFAYYILFQYLMYLTILYIFNDVYSDIFISFYE